MDAYAQAPPPEPDVVGLGCGPGTWLLQSSGDSQLEPGLIP